MRLAANVGLCHYQFTYLSTSMVVKLKLELQHSLQPPRAASSEQRAIAGQIRLERTVLHSRRKFVLWNFEGTGGGDDSRWAVKSRLIRGI